MRKSNLPFVILMLIPFSLAHSTTMSEARQGALDFGTVYKDSASTVINEQNKTSTPGYTTDNPDQTKYYSGANMSGDIDDKVANSDEGKLMTQSLPKRPKVEVSLDDPFLQSARNIETNPQTADEVIAMFTGNYEQCTPIDIVATDVETRTCDFYEERDGGSCLVDQIVEVEAIHDYQCNKTRNARDKVCDRILQVTVTATALSESNFGNAVNLRDGGSWGKTITFVGYANPPIWMYYPLGLYFDVNLSFTSGQKIWITSANGAVNGIYTVSSLSRYYDENFGIPLYDLTLVENVPSFGGNLTIKTQISDPVIVNSAWQEVCPE